MLGQEIIFLLEGVPLTFSVSIIAFLVGLGIGLPLAFLRVYDAEVGFIVDVYEKVFRGIPEIVSNAISFLRFRANLQFSIWQSFLCSRACIWAYPAVQISLKFSEAPFEASETSR